MQVFVTARPVTALFSASYQVVPPAEAPPSPEPLLPSGPPRSARPPPGPSEPPSRVPPPPPPEPAALASGDPLPPLPPLAPPPPELPPPAPAMPADPTVPAVPLFPPLPLGVEPPEPPPGEPPPPDSPPLSSSLWDIGGLPASPQAPRPKVSITVKTAHDFIRIDLQPSRGPLVCNRRRPGGLNAPIVVPRLSTGFADTTFAGHRRGANRTGAVAFLLRAASVEPGPVATGQPATSAGSAACR